MHLASCGYLCHQSGSSKGLKMAETTAGTIPSSMNEGIKHAIIGSTLRTPTALALTWSAPRRASRAAAAWCRKPSTIEVPDSTERARSRQPVLAADDHG